MPDDGKTDLDIIGGEETEKPVDEKPVAPIKDDKPATGIDDETEVKDEPKDEEKEELEEKEEEKEEEEEEEEEEIKDEPEVAKIEIKQIAKEFKGIFKKYPELRNAYFRDQRYAEIYPTVQEAESAAHKAKILDFLDDKVMSGDIAPVIKAVEETNPKSLKTIAKSVLPLLYNTDKSLYHEAVQPAIATMLRVAKEKAKQSGDENLLHSVSHIARFAFGAAEIPSFEDEQPKESPELLEERRKNQALLKTQHENYRADVAQQMETELRSVVLSDIRKLTSEMSDWSRNKLVDEIVDEIDKTLASDKRHMATVNSIWNQIYQSGYSGDLKPSLKSAYLGRAKNLLPQIRQRKLTEALGKKATVVSDERKKETKSPAVGSAPSGKPKVYTREEARGMSDLDIIEGKAAPAR